MFAIAIMLGGCPYKSDVPLADKGKNINAALIGVWEPKSGGSDEKYTVTKDNDYTYQIVKTSKNAKEPTTYKAYAVDVDNETFLNLWQEGEMADKGYYIYKMEVNAGGNKLTLTSMTENVTEKFKTGDELKAFIKKYKGLSFFYDKTQDIFIKD
jgi:hypothetical protein